MTVLDEGPGRRNNREQPVAINFITLFTNLLCSDDKLGVKSKVSIITRTGVKWDKTWSGGFDSLGEALRTFEEANNL